MDIHEIRLHNLEQLIKDSGLSAAKFAEKIGISASQLSQTRSYKYKRNVGTNAARNFEAALDLPHGWMDQRHDLITGKEDYSGEANIQFTTTRRVPIVSMVAAGNWSECHDPFPLGHGDNYIECSKCGENAFAVIVSGDSMSPNFPSGVTIICDPSVTPNNKDMVIAKLPNSNEATFKQLIIEDGQMMLKALNPDWPNPYIPINEECHIIGKVTKAVMDL